MKFRIPYLWLLLSLVVATGLVLEGSVEAQSTATVTVTSTSVLTSMNTTTTTSSTLLTQYTSTTSSALSSRVIQGATVTQYLTQTSVIGNTVENSMTTITSTTPIIVRTETENTTILASAWGIVFVAALALVSTGSIVVSRILAYRNRGKVLECEKCGFSNPPFARSYCIRCGNALSRSG